MFVFFLSFDKSSAGIVVQSPYSGQTILIGAPLSVDFTYTSYSPNFKADLYNGSTYIRTVQNIFSGMTITFSTGDLTPGNQYLVKVYNGYNIYDYGWSDYFSMRDSTPTATSATSITATSFVANWSASFEALSYRLDVSKNSDFAFTNLIINDRYYPSSVTSVTVSQISISSGTSYYYRVRSSNNYGYSNNSNVISVLTLPIAPTGVHWYNSGNNGPPFNEWYAAWYFNPDASGYRIDVATDNGFANILPGFDNLLTGPGCCSGNYVYADVPAASYNGCYYFRVRAVNATGSSSNSTVASECH